MPRLELLVYSQPYRRENTEGSLLSVDTGIFGSVEVLRALQQKTLQEAVDATLDDPLFVRAVH